ncbi:MAG: hypothetical protein OHK0015_47080 [Chloroflexi bacterium OHK40]
MDEQALSIQAHFADVIDPRKAKEPSKQSIRLKRQKAGWNEEFFAKLLVG